MGVKSKHFLAACGKASEDWPIFRFWPKAAISSFNLVKVDLDVANKIKHESIHGHLDRVSESLCQRTAVKYQCEN